MTNTITQVKVEYVGYQSSGQWYRASNVTYLRNGSPASARLNWLASVAEATAFLDRMQKRN